MAPSVESGTLWLDVMGTICLAITAAKIIAGYFNREFTALELEHELLKTFHVPRVKNLKKLEKALWKRQDGLDSQQGLPVPLRRESLLTSILAEQRRHHERDCY